MYTILVPVDGSDHSLKALHIAGDLAEKYQGRMALLHVLARNKQASDFLRLGIAKDFGPRLAAALEAAARAAHAERAAIPEALLRSIGEMILNEAAARVRRRGVEPVVLDIDGGSPAEAILLAAQRVGANTIVMGCRGLSGSRAGSFGSVSDAVFEQARCTCISVK